jgi:hypothetical protein
MRAIEATGQFRRDYRREKKGRHRATLDADLSPVLDALAAGPIGRDAPWNEIRVGRDFSIGALRPDRAAGRRRCAP